MNLTPAIIDAMVASGCTAEQIAAVVKAGMAENEKRLADKRAKDAERQRRHRASRDVTVTECDNVTQPSLSPSPNEINSNPHPHTHPEQTPRARKAGDFPQPDWADSQVWADLKRNRRTKKLTNTPTAHKRFVEAIEAMADDEWPPGKLLEAIVAKGWGGAHDPRDDRKPGNDRRTNDPRPIDRRDGVAKALDRRLGLEPSAGSLGRRDAGDREGYRQLPPPSVAALR